MAQEQEKSEELKILATLALANAIVKDDVKSASEAIAAGANLNAFWIDGSTRLRELVLGRDPKYIRTYGSAEMANLFSPQALKAVPSRSTNRSFWSHEFVRFVAMRGHHFDGSQFCKARDLAPGSSPFYCKGSCQED